MNYTLKQKIEMILVGQFFYEYFQVEFGKRVN